jgi:hypothetical protein
LYGDYLPGRSKFPVYPLWAEILELWELTHPPRHQATGSDTNFYKVDTAITVIGKDAAVVLKKAII